MNLPPYIPSEGLVRPFEVLSHADAMGHALDIAINGAFRYGLDVPVGAVALSNDRVVGQGIASDVRHQGNLYHAEVMATLQANQQPDKPTIDTIVTTFEPCIQCVDVIHEHVPSLERIVYAADRTILENKGDVNPRQSAPDYAAEVGLPFEIIHFDEDPRLRHIGEGILHSFTRDRTTKVVTIDRHAMLTQQEQLNCLAIPS